MTLIRVCVLDDHPMIAEGVRRTLESEGDITVCGLARSGAELQAIMSQHRVDVAIFDARLPGENSLALCAQTRTRYPNTQIMMLSSFFDRALVQKSLAAGASGYALKNISLEALPNAVRQVSIGNMFFSPEIIPDILSVSQSRADGSEPLSRRDASIIMMIAEGKGNTKSL